MKIVTGNNLNDLQQAYRRPQLDNIELRPIIEGIFQEVREKGDVALKKYTHYFDQVNLSDFKVPSREIDAAEAELSEELKEAIRLAKSNIEKFHKAQDLKQDKIETVPGVICWQESRPINKVGIYIPGGTAPLFSTVLMLAIPAQIAGCKEVVMCTPPSREGKVNPAILYAAKLCGVSQIFMVGGAQAIAAMTFGTEVIPPVYKVFGPGNQFVTSAKMKAQEFGVAIDMPAGPSELLVVADETAVPAFVAADLLSQAEHGVDSQVVCIANSEQIIKDIQAEITIQVEKLPRKEIALKAIDNSVFILSQELDFTLEIVNDYAPEHLIVCLKDPQLFCVKVENAGSVFIGNYTPESAGDYASGTNHTLPTSGFAKIYSGVNLDAFQKKLTFQEISKKGIQNIGSAIEVMAEAESLIAHKNAVSIRLKSIKS